MKSFIFIAVVSLFLLACGDSNPPISQKPIKKENSADETKQHNQTETVAAHTLENKKNPAQMPPVENVQKVGPSKEKTKWTRSGNPIDVSLFNKEIIEAEKKLKANPNDAALKKNLSVAYTKRGVALTEARQYAAAIGDYRKALKLDAQNEDAKKWIATITGIYKSINREVPPEGEEPEPLEFKKENT